MHVPGTIEELHRINDDLHEYLGSEFITCLVNKLHDKGELNFVIVYGSRARGSYNYASDVDILVCSSYFSRTPIIDRPDIIYNCYKFKGIPIEPVCLTPSECMDGLGNGNITILDSLDKGMILYAHGDFLSKLKIKFQAMLDEGTIERMHDRCIKWKFNMTKTNE